MIMIPVHIQDDYKNAIPNIYLFMGENRGNNKNIERMFDV